jgi:predicted deacylase
MKYRFKVGVVLMIVFGILPAPAQSQFTLGAIEAKPGQAASGLLPVPGGTGGDTSIPITIVQGSKPGPVLAFIAGVHGSEYAPILALQRVRATLDPKQLAGTVILVQIANLPSFLKPTIYYGPTDGKNLNLVFPGSADGSFSDRIAFTLVEKVMKPADFVVDILSGDNNEMLRHYVVVYYADAPDPKLVAQSKGMAEAFGFDLIKAATGRPTEFAKATYSTNAAILLGKPALAVESGQLGRPTEEAIERIERGVQQLLQHLRMVKGDPQPLHNFTLISVEQTLRSEANGLFYSTVDAGQSVRSGARLGYVTDFFGEPKQEVVDPFDGLLTMVVGTLPVSTGEPVVTIAKIEQKP